jgi:hypothetical protein
MALTIDVVTVVAPKPVSMTSHCFAHAVQHLSTPGSPFLVFIQLPDTESAMACQYIFRSLYLLNLLLINVTKRTGRQTPS